MKYYELSLKAERNLDNLFGYAYFLQKHNQHTKASPFYDEALEIQRKLARVNPQTYLPYVAQTLINLSIYYLSNQANKNKSLELVDEAIDILFPYAHVPYIQNYLKTAFWVINALGIDVESYSQEKVKKYSAD